MDLENGLGPHVHDGLNLLLILGFLLGLIGDFLDFLGVFLELKFEHLCQSDRLEIEFSLANLLASLFHDLDPMSLHNGLVVQVLNEWNGELESLDGGPKFVEWMQLLRFDSIGRQFLGKLLHLLVILAGVKFKGWAIELVPWLSGMLLDHLSVALEDLIDLGVDGIVLIHLNELIELRDGEVEENLREHILLLLDGIFSALLNVVLKDVHTILE